MVAVLGTPSIPTLSSLLANGRQAFYPPTKSSYRSFHKRSIGITLMVLSRHVTKLLYFDLATVPRLSSRCLTHPSPIVHLPMSATKWVWMASLNPICLGGGTMCPHRSNCPQNTKKTKKNFKKSTNLPHEA